MWPQSVQNRKLQRGGSTSENANWHSLDLIHLYAHKYISGVSKHICNFAIIPPFAREHCNSSGFIQTVVDQDFAARSIQTSHLNGVAPSVGPVHVPGHPVHGQSICGLQALADDGLHATAVQICTPRKIKEKMNHLKHRFTWELHIGYFFIVSVKTGVCVQTLWHPGWRQCSKVFRPRCHSLRKLRYAAQALERAHRCGRQCPVRSCVHWPGWRRADMFLGSRHTTCCLPWEGFPWDRRRTCRWDEAGTGGCSLRCSCHTC